MIFLYKIAALSLLRDDIEVRSSVTQPLPSEHLYIKNEVSVKSTAVHIDIVKASALSLVVVVSV